MKSASSSSDLTAATGELRELEKHIEKARRLLSHLERAVVDKGTEFGAANSPLNNHERHLLTLLRSSTQINTENGPVDLSEVNAQLVEAALFMQAESERAELAQRRQTHFLHTFAHELRNPLTPIRTTAAILDHVTADPAAISEVKVVIERQVAHIARLLNDLLDLARVEAGKLSLELHKLNLAELTEEALITYAPVFAKREQILKQSLSPKVFIEADPIRIEQILNNLLDNAAKYTPRGGVITVSVSAPTTTEAELKVADNGIGISADVLPNIFNLYLQDAAASAFNHEGLGIGLAVVQELTKAHGGQIVAHSEGLGKGSEFIITFPSVKYERLDTSNVLQINATLSNSTPSIFKINDALTAQELRNQVIEDRSQIAVLIEELSEANSELLNIAEVRTANEELISSALRAQSEVDSVSAMLQRVTESVEVDTQSRVNQRRAEFLSRASHELRTPLNAILGFGQLMLRDDDGQHYLQPHQRERLESIRIAGQQLLAFTNDMLNSTSHHSASLDIVLKPVEVLDIIGATLTILENKRQARSVQWQWILAEPCSAMADQALLQRALHSVITYAIVNCAEGSMVIGSLRRDVDCISIAINYLPTSVLSSTKIFLSSPQEDNADISLSNLVTARALLELMQGTLSIHHPPKGLSSLEIKLKSKGYNVNLAKPFSDVVEISDLKATSTLHSVLYIEDNPVNVMVMSQIFSVEPQWNFSVATSGAMGIELAISTRPSLILLDMELGDMTGLQVFAALKAANMLPPCGCIAFSADALPEHVQEALKIGLTDYWTKPVNVKLLIEKLHLLFDGNNKDNKV